MFTFSLKLNSRLKSELNSITKKVKVKKELKAEFFLHIAIITKYTL